MANIDVPLLLRFDVTDPNRDVLEGRMRRLILGGLTALVPTLTGCGSVDNNYTVQRLPSGREVKIIGIGKMFFSKGDTSKSHNFVIQKSEAGPGSFSTTSRLAGRPVSARTLRATTYNPAG